MRILILHSRYLSGAASGENRVVEDEARLLEGAGHQVHAWMPTTAVDRPLHLARAGIDAIWSTAAVTEVERLIREYRPEVVHCHNLFPSLSPAVVRAAAKEAAVVMTLHNFRLLCLPATFLRDGRVCEDCLGRTPWPGVIHRCYRDSTLASGALATSLTFHRIARTFERVDLFLAISEFMRAKYIQAGIPGERIRVKTHFAWESPRRRGPGDYFIYLGRLSEEKGVSTLLDAWHAKLGKLLIVGEGPELNRLQSRARAGVEFRGTIPFTDVPRVLADARALLVPSICYEGAPRVVLEAYAAGVPVVASRTGVLPEMIDEDVTGFLAAPGDAGDWARAIERLLDDGRVERLGAGGWRLWNERYRPEIGLVALEQAYQEALGRRKGRTPAASGG